MNQRPFCCAMWQMRGGRITEPHEGRKPARRLVAMPSSFLYRSPSKSAVEEALA